MFIYSLSNKFIFPMSCPFPGKSSLLAWAWIYLLPSAPPTGCSDPNGQLPLCPPFRTRETAYRYFDPKQLVKSQFGPNRHLANKNSWLTNTLPQTNNAVKNKHIFGWNQFGKSWKLWQLGHFVKTRVAGNACWESGNLDKNYLVKSRVWVKAERIQ